MISIILDFETRSVLSLRKPNDVGAWRYSEHPSTSILCAGYLVKDEDERVLAKGVWVKGEPKPTVFLKHLRGEYMIKAFNAPFEIAIWNNVAVKKLGWPAVPLKNWECLMARALTQAFPGSLEKAAEALRLPVQKDMKGHRLMLKMCKPKPARYCASGGVEWYESEEDMKRLAEYCMSDIEPENLLDQQLRPLLARERRLWLLDQKINQRGIRIDKPSAVAAAELIKEEDIKSKKAIIELTLGQVDSPTKNKALQEWIINNGVDMPNMQAETIKTMLADDPGLPDKIRRALEIRSSASKVSVKKIAAMLRHLTADGTAKYNTIFHKASTGRWAGVGIQVHNFPRAKVENNELFFELLNQRDFNAIEFLFGDRIETLSACLRNFLIPREGYKFLVGDYSAVESIGLNCLVGANKKINLYRQGEDVYKHTASILFRTQKENVSKLERTIGKVAELALGYQGAVGAFQRMAPGYGIQVGDYFAQEIVKTWRKANPEIVQFWYATERAATTAVRTGKVQDCRGIKWGLYKKFLCAKLPSGRLLYYYKPKLETSSYGYDKLSHMGIVSYKWVREPTYGGKLVENIVQALCRDLLAGAMFRLDAKGYPMVFTVHDEVIAEVRKDDKTKTLKEFLALLSERPKWAKDYPISAEGWEGERYAKE
jgi:DNA polymerase